ncbi:hypothetical protein QE412_000721 [Microbacterium trichothecenolyticum]|uniref:Uncharacterized protein n=1 Tax=Microbacterium trichothecenolyticum TaxID=69370 RepID=A0ABU0TR49_MICTR|nr:hypothetical protein [Microbacterium trichothecenolyticum]
MNDLDLDTRIRDAAPRLASVEGLSDHRARILREARARSGRRLRVWGASAAASVLLVGSGSVAMAGGGNETPWGWIADNVFSVERTDGSVFFQGLLVKWDGLAEDDPTPGDDGIEDHRSAVDHGVLVVAGGQPSPLLDVAVAAPDDVPMLVVQYVQINGPASA